jgi:MFS family permease
MRTLTQPELYATQRPTLWLSAGALALVYGLFTFGWMVYRVHLPAQMLQIGFSEKAAPLLLLVEALLTVAVEPLAGAFSDRTNRQRGTRFPLIAVGTAVASLLFVIIPALTLFGQPNATLQWLVVGLLLSWSIAMSFFRSPALALLKRYAPAAKLPQAASLLTLAFGLAGAAMPLAGKFILGLGTTVSFTLVAILILLGAMWLRWLNPVTLAASEPAEYFEPAQPVSLSSLGKVFGLGLASTLAFRLAIETFPKILKAQIPGIQPPLFVGVVFVALAIAALPVGKWAVRQGNRRAMLIGIAITALFMVLMPFSSSAAIAWLIALGLGIGFCLILNGTVPFALEQVPPARIGLSVGSFFAGTAVASSLILGVLGKPGVLSPPIAIGLGIVSLFAAAGCIGLPQRRA